MKRDNEPMLDLVDGDVGMSRHLSKALKILAESTSDRDLKKQLQEIRDGKGSLRDLARSEGLARLSDAVMPSVVADIAKKTPQELQELANAGEAVLERYRSNGPGGEATQETEHSEAPAQPQTTQVHAVSPSPAEPASHLIPGTRKPNRDRVVTPDELDDDESYYQERNRNGWLR
ncbi:hypothetical protein [Nocardia lasii]|uniref:DUF222 domain-containing protein n=1 Tax=Nocardia lasii TaxID=1616107 RepID=A0ABW1JNM4_9NOCA